MTDGSPGETPVVGFTAMTAESLNPQPDMARSEVVRVHG